ncbi:hypothetical protein EJ06DRAFT_525500 [Trichodelitschia bisporula]|uniref:Uncharacterized protein n=1 Tax=Trichodelitschia bisporula TaxID=703511 RepID=A0A6G1I9G9_9PEZI|nr:hypothetical protein EJ06DRAFT_525500 [Trichodelitschia bisporula]
MSFRLPACFLPRYHSCLQYTVYTRTIIREQNLSTCYNFSRLRHHHFGHQRITTDIRASPAVTSCTQFTLRNRAFRSTPSTMGSDEDYAAFLDKANQDTGYPTEESKGEVRNKAVDTDVPAALLGVEEYYVSEADEPFEPVSLKWSRDVELSEGEFGKLIGDKAEKIKQEDFDSQGEYAKVVDAVGKAGDGKLHFFKVVLDGTRVEYFVVSVDKKGERVVGLKALSIES